MADIRPPHPRHSCRSADSVQKRAGGSTEGYRETIWRTAGQTRILLRESEHWCVEDVLLVSEICAILHNLLIRMRQSGGLDREILQEDELFDLICQFLVED